MHYLCCIASSFYIKPQPRTPDTLIFGHLTASRHDTKRGGVHRGSRFDAVFTFSTNIRKIIFTEIRRCMSVQRAGARLRSDSSQQIYKNRFIERRACKASLGRQLNSAIVLRLAGSKYPEYPTTPASSRHARPDSLKAQEKRRPNDTRSALLHSPKMRTVSRNTFHESHRNSDLPRCTPHTKRARKKLSAPHFR